MIDNETIRNNRDLVSAYQKKIRQFGFTGRTLLYENDERHTIKISQYAQLLPTFVRSDDTLLDIGCGYGSLVPYLPPCKYHGIDLVPEFIAQARDQYRSLDFQILDLEQCEDQYEWCIMLGIINSVPHPEKMIDLAWDKCTKGLVIDFINQKRVDKKEFNTFNMGTCLEYFLDLGAFIVDVHTTSYPWDIFVVKKQGNCL